MSGISEYSIVLPQAYHMWVVLLLIVGAMFSYTSDKVSLEATSFAVFAILLLWFHFFPLLNDLGYKKITTAQVFAGFANPALVAVIGLLIVGQSVVQTGALNEVANVIASVSRNNAFVSITLCLFVVMGISGILNNTPVVVIFIPILAALSKRLNISVSKVMIPLSYAAIMGGMLTLVGSSTNLLVSGALVEMDLKPLEFFDFTIPGLVMVSVGFIYVMFFAPHLIKDRASFVKSLVGEDERQFVAQLEIDRDSIFVDTVLEEGRLVDFKDVMVRMIQRGEHAYLPPFDEYMSIRSGDAVIVSATRNDLKVLFSKEPRNLLQRTSDEGEIFEEEDPDDSQSDVNLAEVVVSPSSRMIGRTLEHIGFHHNYHCMVLGIQRQSRIIRSRVTDIKLVSGDVLLLVGKQTDIAKLQDNKDILFLEWSTEEIHSGSKALLAGGILTAVVASAAFDLIPISVAAFAGATAVVLTGCLNLRQVKRAVDGQVVLIVVTSLALGLALQETGGAAFIAKTLINVLDGATPVVVMSVLFLAMAALTNILSNNASAVLFTPIAVTAASELNVDPKMFIFAVIFACNCSFVTPIGYQTNLLVMGPGHYKFSDFIKAGLPLAILMWVTYTIFASWYFNV